jgi:hypothetical protein
MWYRLYRMTDVDQAISAQGAAIACPRYEAQFRYASGRVARPHAMSNGGQPAARSAHHSAFSQAFARPTALGGPLATAVTL